ncbi:MAG: YfiR family protein, partial [bacterium]|nr:YfiR family protein [bacterium]
KILDEMMAGEQVYGHPIETRRFARLSDLEVCHLLFISDSVSDRLSDIVRAVEAAGVLTIGESEGFAKKGGMVGLVRDGRNVRLKVAIDVAQRAGFRVSSKLLRVAKVRRGLPR